MIATTASYTYSAAEVKTVTPTAAVHLSVKRKFNSQ